MVLQCEMDYAGAEACGGWLRGATLASLSELNAECLELLAQQARATPGSALLAEIARLWVMLDAAARQRAAGCLYLLLDAGFGDPQHWRALAAPQVQDADGGAYAPFFTVPAAAEVAQAVFTFAWHLARCQSAAARLLLGMPAACVGELALHTLGQVRTLAARHPRWLRPRWSAHPDMWRQFLGAAATGDAAALERARLRGQTLLAAEARLPAPLGRARSSRAEPVSPAGARCGAPECAAELLWAYAPGA
jgi:hypothetical protein